MMRNGRTTIRLALWLVALGALYAASMFLDGVLWSLIYLAMLAIPLAALEPYARAQGVAGRILLGVCGGLAAGMWLLSLSWA